MTDVPWPVKVADGCATDAALAHATAVGLYEVTDRFRFADPAHPIPAPGTADLVDEIHGHALETIHAAATVHALTHDDSTDPAALTDAVTRSQHHCDAARRGVRHLAQIGLGVAQHSNDGDEVELVERTMVAVLDGERVTLAADDDVPLVGRTGAELSVELAGLIARMICERPLTPADAPVGFVLTAGGDDLLTVEITADGGVTLDDADFAAPVTITEVTGTAVARVTARDPGAIGRLTIRWTRP